MPVFRTSENTKTYGLRTFAEADHRQREQKQYVTVAQLSKLAVLDHDGAPRLTQFGNVHVYMRDGSNVCLDRNGNETVNWGGKSKQVILG